MEQPSVDEKSWPTRCPVCGTELQHGTLDFDPTNRPDPEFQAGEMAMVDFCPNPACPSNQPSDEPGDQPGNQSGGQPGGEGLA